MDNYEELYQITLTNVINNWKFVQQNEEIMEHLKNNKLCSRLKGSDYSNNDEWIQANVLSYQIICKYLLSLPHESLYYLAMEE